MMNLGKKIEEIEDLAFYSFVTIVLATGFCFAVCKITAEKLNPFR